MLKNILLSFLVAFPILAQESVFMTKTDRDKVSSLLSQTQKWNNAVSAFETNRVLKVETIDGRQWIDGSNVAWKIEGGYYAWYLSIPENDFVSEILSYRGNETTSPGIDTGDTNVPPYIVNFREISLIGWSGSVADTNFYQMWGFFDATATNVIYEPTQNTISNAYVYRVWIPFSTSRVDLITQTSGDARYILSSTDVITNGQLQTTFVEKNNSSVTNLTVINGLNCRWQVSGLDIPFMNYNLDGVQARALTVGSHPIDSGGSYGSVFMQTEGTYQSVLKMTGYGEAIVNQIKTSGDSFINGGNVGIGTNLPRAKLHVNGDAIFSGPVTFGEVTRTTWPDEYVLRNGGNATNLTVHTRIDVQGSPELNGRIFFANDSGFYCRDANFSGNAYDGGLYGVNRFISLGDWNAGFQQTDVYQQPVNQLRTGGDSFINGGNFGIGTNLPQAKLHVVGDAIIGKMTLHSSMMQLFESTGVNRVLYTTDSGLNCRDAVFSGNASGGGLHGVNKLVSLCDWNSGFQQTDASQQIINQIRTGGDSFINGGKLGIGTNAPAEKLSIADGKITIDGRIYNNPDNPYSKLLASSDSVNISVPEWGQTVLMDYYIGFSHENSGRSSLLNYESLTFGVNPSNVWEYATWMTDDPAGTYYFASKAYVTDWMTSGTKEVSFLSANVGGNLNVAYTNTAGDIVATNSLVAKTLQGAFSTTNKMTFTKASNDEQSIWEINRNGGITMFNWVISSFDEPYLYLRNNNNQNILTIYRDAGHLELKGALISSEVSPDILYFGRPFDTLAFSRMLSTDTYGSYYEWQTYPESTNTWLPIMKWDRAGTYYDIIPDAGFSNDVVIAKTLRVDESVTSKYGMYATDWDWGRYNCANGTYLWKSGVHLVSGGGFSYYNGAVDTWGLYQPDNTKGDFEVPNGSFTVAKTNSASDVVATNSLFAKSANIVNLTVESNLLANSGNIGGIGLTNNTIKIPVDSAVLSETGTMGWDSKWMTLAIKLNDHVTGQFFLEAFSMVTNTSDTMIPDGGAVFLRGTADGIQIAHPLTSTNPLARFATKGLATENIPAHGFGHVTTRGDVNDIPTDMFAEEDVVYASTTPFVLTAIEPQYPENVYVLGTVSISSPTTGRICMNPVYIEREPQTILGNLYGYGSASSDIVGYYSMSNTFTSATNYHTITVSGATNNQTLAKFLALSRVSAISAGDLSVRFYADISKNGSTPGSIYARVKVLTSNMVEIASAESPTVLLDQIPYIQREAVITIPSNMTFSTLPVRIEIDFISSFPAGTANRDYNLYSEDGRPLTLAVPLPSSQFAFRTDLNNYVSKQEATNFVTSIKVDGTTNYPVNGMVTLPITNISLEQVNLGTMAFANSNNYALVANDGSVTASNFIWSKVRWVDSSMAGLGFANGGVSKPSRVEVSTGSGIYGYGFSEGNNGDFIIQFQHGTAYTNAGFPNFYYHPHVHASVSATAAVLSNATFVCKYRIAWPNSTFNGSTVALTSVVSFAQANFSYIIDFGYVTNNLLQGHDSIIIHGNLERLDGLNDVASPVIVDYIDFHYPISQYGSFGVLGDHQ